METIGTLIVRLYVDVPQNQPNSFRAASVVIQRVHSVTEEEAQDHVNRYHPRAWGSHCGVSFTWEVRKAMHIEERI